MTRIDLQIAGYLASSAIVAGIGLLLMFTGVFAPAPVRYTLALLILGSLFLTGGAKLYLKAF
jgi:hypothetical protein